jgi:DNA-binding NtrC family response regulator
VSPSREGAKSKKESRDREAAWVGVSAAFAAFGRAFICVDSSFRVIHVSRSFDELLHAGACVEAEGRPLEEILGSELFGHAGALRLGLLAGERREGWRAHARVGNSEHRLVSLSAAPFPKEPGDACDPRVAFVVILRPAEEDTEGATGSPTAISGQIVRSPAMLRIFGLIESLRQSEATVLITGESGTGKEVVARALHEHSPRRGGPFVAVNCGALPSGLLESEMFGHVRGAFTGAVRDRVGRFEAASHGTLFLDEVGDLPLELQVKLLRVLQDGTFERVGESATRTSLARVIAATHVDLTRAVREGRFREDLYYRLRVVPIEVPPLRERREDIEPLARSLLARVGARQGRALRFSHDAIRALLAHDWPGNVRELENAVEYAVAVCRGQTIQPEDLPEIPQVRAPRREAAVPSPTRLPRVEGIQPPGEAIANEGDVPTSTALRETLEANRWKRSAAARALGVSRTTLWRWMRERGLSDRV